MSSKKSQSVERRNPSVAPARIETLETTLDEKLQLVKARLAEQTEVLSQTVASLEGWQSALREAKARRKKKRKVSSNAQKVTDQLIGDAEERIQRLINAATTLNENVFRLEHQVKQASDLKTRMDVQRFREGFAQQDEISAGQAGNDGLTVEEITAIERDLRAWSHSLDALKELRGGAR